MEGLVLIWVGAVLCLNGVSLLTPLDPREVAVINLFVAVVTGFAALWSATREPVALPAVLGGAVGLMFTLTYLWNGINTLTGADGRAFGWFSLFVAITVAAVGLQTLAGADRLWGVWSGLNWLAWSGLWFLFFVMLVLRRPIARLVGAVLLAEGVLTAWLPGYLLLSGAIG